MLLRTAFDGGGFVLLGADLARVAILVFGGLFPGAGRVRGCGIGATKKCDKGERGGVGGTPRGGWHGCEGVKRVGRWWVGWTEGNASKP